MASKSAPRSRGAARRRAKPRRPAAAKSAQSRSPRPAAQLGDLSKMPKLLTPQQAFELYRANAKMALDVINASIESAAKLRKLQYEGEEEARSMQKKAVRHAAEASDAQSLMAAGQAVTQEAVEKAMQGVMASGGSAFDSMQRVMGDFARMAQQSMPGVRR